MYVYNIVNLCPRKYYFCHFIKQTKCINDLKNIRIDNEGTDQQKA